MDINSIKYNMFLAEQLSEQAKFETCINESILISEGKINEIQTIHEAFADKVKENIKKFFEMIKRMWTKFIETMDTLVKKDKDYLEKYKEIILNKKMIDAEYNMYNYKEGIRKILNTSVPAFNYNLMKDKLESQETFISKEFPEFKTNNEDENFIDVVKSKFRGGSEKISIHSSKINMTDLYNYCKDYEKMKTSIQKDENTINKAATDAINLIDKMIREEKIKSTNESYLFSNKYYSYLYESYILENEKTNDQQDKSKELNKNVSREENNNTNQSDNNNNSENSNNKTVKLKEDDIKNEKAEDVRKKIEVYSKTCGDVIAAKLTVTEEIYKAYISIIKTHVRDHISKKNKSSDDNKSKDVATDYNKNNNDTSKQTSGDESSNNNETIKNDLEGLKKEKEKYEKEIRKTFIPSKRKNIQNKLEIINKEISELESKLNEK